jgi:hypothetical protein
MHLGPVSAVVVLTLFASPSPLRAAEPDQKCAAAKVKAVSAASNAELRCFEKAAKQGTPVDQGCLDAVRANLDATFLKAERKGGCDTIDDARRTSARVVDPFGVVVAAELPTSAAPGCSCGDPPPAKLQVTGSPPGGICGTVRDALATRPSRSATTAHPIRPLGISASSTRSTSC